MSTTVDEEWEKFCEDEEGFLPENNVIIDSEKQREINQVVSKFFFGHFDTNKIYFWY